MDASFLIAGVACLIALLTFISNQWQMRRKASNGYVERVEGRARERIDELTRKLERCEELRKEERLTYERRLERSEDARQELEREKMALLEKLVERGR